MKHIFITLLTILLTGNLFAQNLDLKLLNEENELIPLHKITINENNYRSHANGIININPNDLENLDTSLFQLTNDSLKLANPPYTTQLSFTSIETNKLIKEIIKNPEKHQLKSLAPFAYKAYNKFSIHSTKREEGSKFINKWLKIIDLEIKHTDQERFVMLSESMSEREFLSPLLDKETILWSKLSGVDKALFLSMNSQLQTTDIYSKHIKVLGGKYVNPFQKSSHNGYQFNVTDTLTLNQDTLIQINFYPKKMTRFEAIQGFVWVNTKNKGIESMYCEPSYRRKARSTYAIEFDMSYDIFTPKIINTTMLLNNISKSKLKVTGTQTTYIQNFKTKLPLEKKQFSDLALTYKKQLFDSVIRPIPLSIIDSNTYTYFKKGDNVKINRPLKWGEELFFGNVHTKFVNIKLNDILGYNQHEGLRTGLGLSSNESLSDKLTIYGNFAYGWKDKAWKGNFKAKLDLLPEDKLSITTHNYNDLLESGSINSNLVKPFFGSEFLRKYQLFRFEQQIGTEISLKSKPIKYLRAELALNIYKNISKYQYSFSPEQGNQFRDLKLDVRFAYGERFFRFYNNNISLKSKYPIAWLNLEKSVKSSNYNYTRAQLRVRYTHQFIINGKSKFEVLAGKYWGQLPYFKLFNGLGSASMKSLVGGSFETMQYNEFTSDKFLILFYTHDFGYFNFTKNKTFRPHIEVAFNYGIGSLMHKKNHKFIHTQSFEKGFAEVGVSINDLLLLYPFGVKLGLGASFYHRILYYRYPTFKENSILKLTTSFLI